MISSELISEKIFKILKGHGYQVEMFTDEGWIDTNYHQIPSIGLDLVIFDFTDRGEGKTKAELRPDGSTSTQGAAYMEFILYSSNNRINYYRHYTKILDVFASVGGVIRNPNVELLFQSMSLRTFDLTFRMSPYYQGETKII